MVAPVMEWLRTQCRRSGECTHLSLGTVKGSFTIPRSLDDAFQLKYARAIAKSAEHLSLIEVKTDVFPLFADLDWKSQVTREQLLEVAKFVSQQAFLIYAPSSREHVVVVATRQPVERGGCYKNGMHIHWPGIHTTAASAQVFRRTAVERCRERFGGMVETDWEGTIDEHVYKGSGLRMLYSRKQCAEDVYAPTWKIQLAVEDLSGLRQPILQSVQDIPPAADGDQVVRWIRMCSVRQRGGVKTPLQECVEEASGEGETGPKIQCDLEVHSRGLEALKQVLPPCYRTCKFIKLTKGEDRAFLTPDVRTCLNLEPDASGQPGAHKSNNVYFVISSATTYQACFCSCETVEGRLNGPCKSFRSNHFPTPQELAQSLFPCDAKPFACGGVAFTTPAATAATMYDRFFGPGKTKHVPAPAKRRRVKK